MLAILSSMPFESETVLSDLKKVRQMTIAEKKVFKGRLSGLEIIVMSTGIGKVNAAHSITSVFERFSVKGVINLGVGGAYPGSGLENGDIAVASKEIYGDDGVIESGGWESLKKIGIPLAQVGGKKYFNEYPVLVPQCCVQSPVGAIHELPLQVKTGTFVTVSAASGTQKRASELEKRFKAICENMEGAAIAHVCAIYGVPMFEVRGISNTAGVRDKRKWNMKLASENCQNFFLHIVGDLIK